MDEQTCSIAKAFAEDPILFYAYFIHILGLIVGCICTMRLCLVQGKILNVHRWVNVASLLIEMKNVSRVTVSSVASRENTFISLLQVKNMSSLIQEHAQHVAQS